MGTTTVELFGLARLRTGVRRVELPPGTLGQVLQELQRRLPALAGWCVQDGRLAPGFIVSVNRQYFTQDPQVDLAPGDVVLLISADPGG